jgi:phosphoglycolate phosphatase-like HAD superfamily hydrolase
MKNRLVLCFDFDGVIVDNTLCGFRKVNNILAEIGSPPASDSFLKSNWGKPASELFKNISELMQLNDSQIAFLNQRNHEINEIEGMRLDMDLIGALLSLREFGLVTAVITNRDRQHLEIYSKQIDLDLSIFDYIQTISDYPCRKPDGDVFKPLLQWAQHEVGPKAGSSIAYFGDTIQYDYRAVLNAKAQGHDIKFIGVCSGVNDYEEFLAAGLTEKEIISSHDALSSYLTRLIQEKNRGIARALVKKLDGNVDLSQYAFL